MRGLLDAASAETRDLTTEEQSRYDEMFAEQERVGGQIAREERQQDLDRRMAEMAAHGSNGDGRQSGAETRDATREDRANPRATPEYRAAFARFLRGGVGVLAGEELRALQAGADVDGGYLVAPQQFVTELIKAVDDQVAIRGLARTFQAPQAASMGAPSLDADPADADWTTELQTGAD
jgi:HK97 family phage major capsid protein